MGLISILDMNGELLCVLSLVRLYLAGFTERSLLELDFCERILMGPSTCDIYLKSKGSSKNVKTQRVDYVDNNITQVANQGGVHEFMGFSKKKILKIDF